MCLTKITKETYLTSLDLHWIIGQDLWKINKHMLLIKSNNMSFVPITHDKIVFHKNLADSFPRYSYIHV
jgi:hypothetical protein